MKTSIRSLSLTPFPQPTKVAEIGRSRASAVALDSETAANTPTMRVSVRSATECRDEWEQLLARAPQAALYHSFEWQQVLRLTYGVDFQVTILEERQSPIAACVLARSRNPFSRRLIALPFSDYCPPLSVRSDAAATLLRALAAQAADGTAYEIRGATADPPWQVADCFAHWTLDLNQPLSAIEKSMDRNFRRQVRRAVDAGVTVVRGSSREYAKRFYALHLETRRRLGLPAPPWRFLRLVQEILGRRDRFEVCLAIAGRQDVAGAVLLKDGRRLHCKWSARSLNAPTGAGQLIFWSLCEHYAGEFGTLDLGRTDVRNKGLSRYKREMGAVATPLPYAFYPRIPTQISSERTTGLAHTLSRLWRRLPMPLTRALGAAIYGYLS